MALKSYIFELTPLGKADKEVRSYLRTRLADHQMQKYHIALRHYRHMKVVHSALKALLYASLITSIAATVGFGGQVAIIEQIASYIGTSIIFLLFSVTSYITMIRRETYHVQREILISQATFRANQENLSG